MRAVLRRVAQRLRKRPPAINYAPTGAARSRAFRQRAHDRYWWHRLADTDHLPALYSSLSQHEWVTLEAWFTETERCGQVGEINVPAMSLINGLVSGSGIRRIVQLGHFVGYSALLLGWTLKAMDASRGLFSIDIDPELTAFTAEWVARAGVTEQVILYTGDSSDPASRDAALAAQGGPPQLVLVDSSHGYAHTLRELDLWWPILPIGALVVLHDTSEFARTFDPEGAAAGGVKGALEHWISGRVDVAFLNLNGFVPSGADVNALAYKDGCGMGLLQKTA